MSLSLADIKRADVGSFRDVAAALEKMATANGEMKTGVGRLPIAGEAWKGASGDAAHHELDGFAQLLGSGAEAQKAAAGKIRRAADEFEGVKQLLAKIEQDAAKGKFKIDLSTGTVTPPSGDYNKSDLDYLTNTLKQIMAAGDAANADLAAAVKSAKDAPAGSGPAGALPISPGSTIKPGGVVAGMEHLAGPNPDGDPAETKAAGAAGVETPGNFYKEWYPKAVDVGDKPVDPSKLGAVGSVPGVVDPRDKTPQPLAPRLADKDVPMFKEATRQQLRSQGVPADQIEAKVNDAVARAQTPHFLPDPEQMRTPGATPLDKPLGDRFIDFTVDAQEGFYESADGAVEQGKVLTGQAGPGAPGVAEAWKDLGINSGKALFEQTVNPLGTAIDEVKSAIDEPGNFAGRKLFEATAVAPTLPLGGEGAALARGLEGGAIERGLLGDVSRLDDGHHSSGGDHTPSPAGDHSSPSAGGHPYAPVTHDAPAPAPLPSDHPLFEGYHPAEPGPKYTNPDGSLRYPDASDPAKPYAVPGTVVDNVQLQKGTALGRFGYPGGEWLAPEGTPFAQLSLPHESALKPYFHYVVDDPAKIPPGWRIEQSQVAPWFHQPGMGPQYRVIAPPGVRASTQELVDWGFLKEVG